MILQAWLRVQRGSVTIRLDKMHELYPIAPRTLALCKEIRCGTHARAAPAHEPIVQCLVRTSPCVRMNAFCTSDLQGGIAKAATPSWSSASPQQRGISARNSNSV